MSELSGRCFCKAVSWSAKSDILWAAFCHCEDCRRASSADYVSWLGVERGRVVWQGPRQFFQSSEKVTRSFCGDCGAQMSFETSVFPEETHLYAASLENPKIYQPTAHLYWSERLPWVEFNDGLPKHQKGLQAAGQSVRNLLGEIDV